MTAAPTKPFGLSLSFDKLRMIGFLFPFALSLSKGRAELVEALVPGHQPFDGRAFDKLSPCSGRTGGTP